MTGSKELVLTAEERAIILGIRERGHSRPEGWYWVRKAGWGDEFGPWTPALWRPDAKAWYSVDWSGIPDRHMIIGEKIESPKFCGPDGCSDSVACPKGGTK